MRPVRVLTWHVHGSYMKYLSRVRAEFFLPVKPGRPEGYGGKSFDPGATNMHEVGVDEVKDVEVDVVIFQSRKNYEVDQDEILTPEQKELPRIMLEHDPPREHPTDTKHYVDDPEVVIVHVTPFNKLMWDNGENVAVVIDHGVEIPSGVSYRGNKAKGLVVVNGLGSRGRRVGRDILERVAQEIPLEVVGMGSEEVGGRGEVDHDKLPELMAEFRFLFNPIRYTSLGLSVIEAMMVGLPVVGLATTEMATTIKNGKTGYVDTRIEPLIQRMRELLESPLQARMMSRKVKREARRRFGIERFKADWEELLRRVAGKRQWEVSTEGEFDELNRYQGAYL